MTPPVFIKINCLLIYFDYDYDYDYDYDSKSELGE